jgi:putative RecB family exonuclease
MTTSGTPGVVVPEPVPGSTAVPVTQELNPDGALPPRSTSRSLSPSRASTFMQCPLLYRFRVIDKIPEAPSPAAVRGTVVHAVLERIFDLPAVDRTIDKAQGMIDPAWRRISDKEPELAAMFADENELVTWLAEARALVERWFDLEDPTRLEPAHRELLVESVLESGLMLRGYIDRLDIAPDGRMRVVDYKTGKAPKPAYEAKALFQMKFYALVLWRIHGRIPTLLQLVYLGDGRTLRYEPQQGDLEILERKVVSLGDAIAEATRTGRWRPSKGPLCGWCDHRVRCPEFGGTPPPLPEIALG